MFGEVVNEENSIPLLFSGKGVEEMR